jgi:hypothetical protein
MLHLVKNFIVTSAMLMTVVCPANAMDKGMMHSNPDNDSTCMTKISRQYGFISPGGAQISTRRLNEYLATQGVSAFRTTEPTLSLGMHKELQRLIMESNFTMRFWRDRKNADMRTSLFMGDIVWNTGYNVLPTEIPVNLFPYLGLGVGLNSIRFRSDTKTLAQLRASSDPNVLVSQAAFLLNAGVGSDFILSNKEKTRGMVIGLRAGYLLDPLSKRRDWYSGRTEIEDMPNLKQSGVYGRIILGGWGSHQ